MRKTTHDTRRRFEQWARNPACEANTLSAVHGIKMADVARKEGIEPTMGQSPFALARGQVFERRLFENDGLEMRKALEAAGILPAGSEGFEDLRIRMNGGKRFSSLEAAVKATNALLASVAAQPNGEGPTLVGAATLRIPGNVMLPDALLVVDALAIRTDVEPKRLVVGEVKTYADRAGFTDRTQLAGARAQAGVYAHGLQLVVDELGLTGRLQVALEGFLVLTRPGQNAPSIRPAEDLRYQCGRAQRGFARLRDAAGKLKPTTAPEDQVAAVLAAETAYDEVCMTFCDRAEGCHKRAQESGDAAVLGREVKRFLGSLGLPRAVALMDGAKPAGDAETELAELLRGTAV